MEESNCDQTIPKGSVKCYPPSSENAMRTVPFTIVPTNDLPSGASVSMQTNQTSSQSSSSGCSSGDSSSAESNGSRMGQTRYYTRQHAPPKVTGPAGLARAPSWLLIEWERPNGEPNTYAAIASTQIVHRVSDRFDQSVEKGEQERATEYYTGNLIHVRRGQFVLPATIVMVSEDKKFIETELRQLRKMAANNLKSNPNPTRSLAERQTNFTALDHHAEQQIYHQTHPNDPERAEPFPEWKHRATLQHHVDQQDTVPTKKRLRHDSLSSCTEPAAASPTFSEACSCKQSIVTGPRAEVHSAERIITPRSDRTVYSNVVQPMTFDQQTQTIGPAFSGGTGDDAQFGKILSYLESIMAEQKSSRMEREFDRKLLQDLQEKLVVQATLLRSIEQKLALQPKAACTDSDNGRVDPNNVSDTGLGMELSLIDRCVVTSVDEQFLCVYPSNENEFIESSARETRGMVHLDANSNQSWEPSVNAGTMNAVSIDGYQTNAVTNAAASFSYPTVEPTKNFVLPASASVAVKQVDSIDDLKRDWNDHDDDQDEPAQSNDAKDNIPSRLAETAKFSSTEEMVLIGAHGTLVKQAALDKIKWSNYKSATRKLLMEVFGREKLATHSLSGRPSPAMRRLADRPVKARLEEARVADVMDMVCKMCNIDEALVRNVITAKCADENKMRKQKAGRMQKQVAGTKATRLKMESGSVALDVAENKENICQMGDREEILGSEHESTKLH